MKYAIGLKGKPIAMFEYKPTIVVVEEEKDALLMEMGKVAKEIHQLRHAFNMVNANEDPTTFDRIVIRLDAAEREYFLLFNQLRAIKGLSKLKGSRFTYQHFRDFRCDSLYFAN